MSVEVMSGGGASPKLQTKTVTPSTSSQSVTPDDGYDGLSKVTVNAMPSGTLNTPTVNSSGLVTASVGTSGYLASGTNKTLQLTTQASKTVTPSTSNQTAVASGRYTTGAVTVKGDSNLVASNIKSGVSIFGVSGSLQAGEFIEVAGSVKPPNDSAVLSVTLNKVLTQQDIDNIEIVYIRDGHMSGDPRDNYRISGAYSAFNSGYITWRDVDYDRLLSEYIGDPRTSNVFSFNGNTVTINVSDRDAGRLSKFSQYYTYMVSFFIRVT